jgi:hypothetical protein
VSARGWPPVYWGTGIGWPGVDFDSQVLVFEML